MDLLNNFQSGNSPPNYTEPLTTRPPFTPSPSLILPVPPPLDPAWLAHEAANNLLNPPPPLATAKERQQAYSTACKLRNAARLRVQDADLADGLAIYDTLLDANNGRKIPIRSYNPEHRATGPAHPKDEYSREEVDIVIYYHGGGLYVGDLDSEDLTCRRICRDVGCTVYSVDYRLMPEFTADDAFHDALAAFRGISNLRRARRLILMGSSSGGQLAAMVSQATMKGAKQLRMPVRMYPQYTQRVHGVLLRGPVTCDATDGGVNLPTKFRDYHTSMSEAFHTSLLSNAAVNKENRTKEIMPLEGELEGLPRHWIQVCTNDVYYSDGVLYAEALKEAGVDVELDIVEGWPHTFWLKASELDRAIEAEKEMVEGLRWLLESPVEEEEVKNGLPLYDNVNMPLLEESQDEANVLHKTKKAVEE